MSRPIRKLRNQPFQVTFQFPTGLDNVGVVLTWGWDILTERVLCEEVQPTAYRTPTLIAPSTSGEGYFVLADDGQGNHQWIELTVTTGLYVAGEDDEEDPDVEPPFDLTDIAVLVPRVRRALGDVAENMTDQQVLERTADAIAGILLFSEGEMGVRLLVASRDQTGAPTGWKTSRELTEEEGTVFALQAAIDALDGRLSGLVSEKFGSPVDSYEYQLSAQALTAKLKRLVADRDRAIEILLRGDSAPVAWVNTLGIRDRQADMAVNPWLYGG